MPGQQHRISLSNADGSPATRDIFIFTGITGFPACKLMVQMK
jgi:hypothetical protein